MFRFTNIIIFRLTRDCNLNCKYCFMKEIIKENSGELIEFDLFKNIIDRIVEQRVINNKQKELLTLVFHGGEALLVGKEKLFQMAEYITKKMNSYNCLFNIGIQTNSTLIDDDYAKIFNKFSIGVSLSFDGISEDEIGRTKISQKVFEEKFKILESNKINYGFIIVAGKHNINNIDKTQKYIENLSDMVSYKINYVEDMNNPGKESKIELSGEVLFEKVFIPKIKKYINNEDIKDSDIKNSINKTIIDIISEHEDEIKTGCYGKFCGAGVSMIAIEPNGEMNYCDRFSTESNEIYIQNALDYDFLGLYQLKKVLEFNLLKNKIIKETGCDTCYADYICDHGCMAFHYSKHGEYGIDKRLVCNLYKNLYKYIMDNLDDIINTLASNSISLQSQDNIIKIKDNIYSKYIKSNIEIKHNKNLIIFSKEVR